ncbi:MAG: hypothetical protein E6J90_50825 [Deltaproteobacteria bacterium]|nr:MAG: hypothetical protein E6J91_43355 [Deltaproteobacteria bacterium]TMQ04699.1 MAG: hypothetical protein E6J90_50825 [Deltaproteobacteria bacterium]
MSRVALVALCLIGCGRLGFRLPADDGGSEPDPFDAPPVPASICKVDRFPLPSVPHVADLAIAPSVDGYAAIWLDASFGGSARGAVIGSTHQLLHSAALPGITDSRIGGLADAGQKLVVATATGTSETLWTVEHDLSAANAQATLASHLLGHDPFPSDGQGNHAFVTAKDKSLEVSRVAGNGAIDLAGASLYSEDASIDKLACSNGPGHSYCVWEKTNGPSSLTCNLGSVIYLATGAPKIGSHRFVFLIGGCPADIRVAPGPAAADSTIIVTSNPSAPANVGVFYAVSSGDVSRLITDMGSAAKIQFDGKRFWIAWLDPDTELRLTSLELNGTVIQYMLPGWTPAGPQGFQLVSSGSETMLALVSPSGLDLLTICP